MQQKQCGFSMNILNLLLKKQWYLLDLPELRQKAKFVAIPSTSGTATEVTAFSVITDYKAKIKYPLADFNITPDIAIS